MDTDTTTAPPAGGPVGTETSGARTHAPETRNTGTHDAGTPGQETYDAGTYDVLRRRLHDRAAELARRAEALNARRTEEFGSTELRLTGTERIRTRQACVPRDLVAVGGRLLFGFERGPGIIAVIMQVRFFIQAPGVFRNHHQMAIQNMFVFFIPALRQPQ